MKILVINYQSLPVPPVKGGAVEYLIDAFLKYNEKNNLHKITLYSIFDKAAEEEALKYKNTDFKFIKLEGIGDKISRIVRHLINRFFSVYVGNAYIAKVLKCEGDFNKYDAIIIENTPEFGLMIPKSFKGRRILHLHNDYLNIKTKLAKKIFDVYDEIYTISDELGGYVRTIAKSDKVKTLHNGVDLNKFSFSMEARNEIREKYNIKKDDFVFMYCGRIVPDKGVYELVRAFSQLERENVKLIIAGGITYSSRETSEYFDKVKSEAGDNVIFTGFIPYSDIPKVYTAADVGVAPSMCNDAFNLTVVEFFANGIPVIISDMGAMKELVNEKCSVTASCNGDFILNLKNAMEYMLKCDMEKMREESKKVSAHFSIETYCERFKTLLEKGI